MTAVLPMPVVGAAMRGTYVAFIGSGFAFSSWASRIPQVKSHLSLDAAALGLLLLAMAAGSVLALPLSGQLVGHLGSRRTVTAMSVLLSAAMAMVAVGYLVGVWLVVVGLFLLGLANGAWDVGMNVQGAVVERHLGRSVMSRFHAGFSLGMVAGALGGAGMVALHVPVTAHLLGVAVLVVVGVAWGTRDFVPDVEEEHLDALSDRRALDAWREPRTLLIGLFVLTAAFAEGAGNDWISLASIEGYGLSAAVGTLVFAAFLVAMTTGRWFGPALLDRFGRVPVVRALSLLSVVGLLVFVLSPVAPLAFVGAVLWGLGASLGFPVGMSAGADEPALAPGRVSVIASIGYCAFLGGPPLIGLLGNSFTIQHALVAVAVLLALGAALAPVVHEPRPAGPR